MLNLSKHTATPPCMLPKPGRPGTFQEHVLQLDPWEYSLLNNVVLTQDPFTITSIFMLQSPHFKQPWMDPLPTATGHLVG